MYAGQFLITGISKINYSSLRWRKFRIMSSKFSFPTKAFSIERIDKADNLSSGPTRGGTKGTSYPGPVGTGTREDKSAQAKFFCNQAQT